MVNMQSARRSSALLVALAALAPASAQAQIVEYPLNPSATPLARAMAGDASIVRRASFSALPPSAKPAAVAETRLAGFPTQRQQLRHPQHGQRPSCRRPQRRHRLRLGVARTLHPRGARRRDHAH